MHFFNNNKKIYNQNLSFQLLNFLLLFIFRCMQERGIQAEKYQRQTPDAYSLLSWKDTTSLCEYDTFDEYLKAQCKQLLCLNQSLKNKVMNQQGSIQYLVKVIQSKDLELERMEEIMKREQNIKTAKKGSGINGEFGSILNAAMLSKSINQQFLHQYPEYALVIEQNKRLTQKLNSKQMQVNTLKSKNLQLIKEIQLLEEEASNLKQKIVDHNNMSATIERLSKSIQQKTLQKQELNKQKMLNVDLNRANQMDILKKQLGEKTSLLNTISKQYHQLISKVSQYKKIADQETKRSQFLSKNLIQLTNQFKNDKKKLQANIMALQGQFQRQQNNQVLFTNMHNRSMDKAEVKIIQSCQSQQSDFQGFSRGEKRVGSIKTKSLRENQRSDIQNLIDRYYRIKANNF